MANSLKNRRISSVLNMSPKVARNFALRLGADEGCYCRSTYVLGYLVIQYNQTYDFVLHGNVRAQ